MPAEFKRVKEIFLEAVEQAGPEGREARLRERCGDDAALRRQVEALLRQHEETGSFLEPSPVAPGSGGPDTASAPGGDVTGLSEIVGTRVGPYELVRKLGEGGMGAVWVAEQSEPVRRRVALKVIKPGMDSERIIRRFGQERQALALMDHENIARVLDAGATPEGRPYFVMELIEGVPITHYCDEHRLPLRERLELFVPVCQAVQHAHQKGVLHRDVKPSNVLVAVRDGRPVPKVIDFGVAKALHRRLADESLSTEPGALLGTLEYMSPEQAKSSGLDVDTRADVYALGVLLYEMLTGTTPFDRKRLRETAFPETLRIIREEEPPLPSARLAESPEALADLAALRRTEPGRLLKEVRGELDWIALKCLEKDRTRRYETADGLARDVGRYLADEPVEACPPSRRYRLGKYLRRHRAGVVTAAAVFLALVAGIAGTTAGLMRALDAEQLAKDRLGRAETAEAAAGAARDKALGAAQEAREAEADMKAFGDFLVGNVLATPRPKGVQLGQGVSVTVAEALEAAEKDVAKVFAGQPKAEATARHALGVTWRNLGKYAAAERHLRRAVELRERELGPYDPLTIDSRNSLAVTWEQEGRHGEALEMHRRNLDAYQRVLGPDHLHTLSTQQNLAAALDASDRRDLSLPLFEQTLKQQQAALGPDHPSTLTTLNNLAFAYRGAGKLPRALSLSGQAYQRRLATLGPDHADTLNSMYNLAESYRAAGRLDRAVSLFEEALAKQQTVLGPDHPLTLTTMNGLAYAYRMAGQLDRALPLFRQTLEGRTAVLGPDHPNTLTTMNNLAEAYHAAGQLDKALPLSQRSVEGLKARLGPDHHSTLTATHNLARAYQAARQPYKALPLYEQTLAKMRVRLGPDHHSTLTAMNNLGEAYRVARKPDKAAPLLEEGLEGMRAVLGPDHADTLTLMHNLALAYRDARKLDRAMPLFERALERRTATLGPNHPHTQSTRINLAYVYRDAGLLDKSIPLQEQTLEQRKAKLGPDHALTLIAMSNLAETYSRGGNLDRAVPLFEQALSGMKAKLEPGHPNTLTTMENLAFAYQAAEKLDREEPLLREALTWRRKKDGPKAGASATVQVTLGRNLLRQKKYAEAEPFLREGLAFAEAKLPDDWRLFNARSLLGGALAGQEKYAEAEPLLAQGYEGMKRRETAIPTVGRALLTEALLRLVQLYEVSGQSEKAAVWRKELEKTKAAQDRAGPP
jgi:serine/threonine protein kinase/lipopolysaccharide biosynthesis regulator YciM